MYKEKLQEIITEKFMNEKIGIEKFIQLSEKIDKISEKKAEKIVTEQIETLALIGIVTAISIGNALLIKKLVTDIATGKNYCKKINSKIIDQEKKKKSIAICRIQLMRKTIAELKAARPKCNGTKNPKKCLKRIESAIRFYDNHIFKIKQKM